MGKLLLPVICGPTASGKTAIAVALCERIGGEVVSADSMQIYRGMDILSAKPTREEMHGIAHHLIDCADPSEKYSADRYREAAKRCIAEIYARGKIPVLCGGTGLYINAVTRPMSFAEKSDPILHEKLLKTTQTPEGRRALHDRLEKIDPESAARLHENDARRVARAIEVYELTGKTQTEQMRLDREREGDYDERLFAPDWPRETLYDRIDKRVDQMLRLGLLEEVQTLLADADRFPTAEQAIGYKEIASALRGETTMEHAVWEVHRATRNYAKRQLTWFRHDDRVQWLDAQGRTPSELAKSIEDNLDFRQNEEK